MKDVVRVRYLIPERTEFEKTFPILQKWFGDAKPAATVMICGLYEEGVKIEIEVTARRSSW
jgi:enamine deaminase RidA (YjgF/YER057c/UK114 family)